MAALHPDSADDEPKEEVVEKSDCAVLYVSPSGSDANSGCDAASPLRTVSACVGLAADGATCKLAAGTYRDENAVVEGASGRLLCGLEPCTDQRISLLLCCSSGPVA